MEAGARLKGQKVGQDRNRGQIGGQRSYPGEIPIWDGKQTWMGYQIVDGIPDCV